MEITQKEFEILAHTLGINLEEKRKGLHYSRNFFSASDTHNDIETLMSLREKDLMFKYDKFGGQVFSVTEKGQDFFAIEYFKRVN
jgi:predicted transcriptional regulator